MLDHQQVILLAAALLCFCGAAATALGKQGLASFEVLRLDGGLTSRRLLHSPPAPTCALLGSNTAAGTPGIASRGVDANQTYEECLAAHGKSLDTGFDTRWLQKAATVDGKERLDLLMKHVISRWLWVLKQREGTPCSPLVFLHKCAPGISCGGIGDRLKGLQVTFWLAVLTNSVFVLDWTRPVPLEEFFLPLDDALAFPEYRKCLDGPEAMPDLRRVLFSPYVVPYNHHTAKNETLLRQSNAFIESMPGAAQWRGVQLVQVRCKTAYLPHMMLNPTLRATLALYGLANNPLSDLLYIAAKLYMGRPSPRLEQLAVPVLEQLARGVGCTRIGVHIRLGDVNLPASAVGRRASINLNDRRYDTRAVVCWVRQALLQCQADAPRPCTVFLTTDSQTVVQSFSDQMAVHGIATVTTAGAAFHLDRAVNETEVSYDQLVQASSKDYLDWYILTQTDSLVMSDSGFAYSAAYSARPRRAVWLAANARQCDFHDFVHNCVALACPGQMGQTQFLRQALHVGSFR